ncbi:DUF6090 family protein [Winogradskyella sp. A2]|uniref:DUF6090 family protein n=1 Tax=Winogradskyella sp. A2 TaxID=3366944 RepID=UPI00398C5793
MIKFFRKIRQNLLSEGKTGKYLKYAIGEIILVMIGILLALQVNNWNENRKLADSEKLLLKELLNDLEFSKSEIVTALSGNKYLLSKYKSIGNAIEEDIEFNDSLSSAFSSLAYWSSPYLPKSSFESIKNKDLKIISNPDIRQKLVKFHEFTYVLISEDYNKMEWNFSQTITLPVLLKNIHINIETGNSTPDDFEALKKDRIFHNYLNQLIVLREGGLNLFETALKDIETLSDAITKEIDNI